QKIRAAAARAHCQNTLKQIGIATHLYHDGKKRFPVGVHLPVFVGDRPTGGTNVWVELLPYLEQGNLHDRWDPNDNRNNVAGERDAIQAQVIKILICPSDPLPQPVAELTAANSIHSPWCRGSYGLSSYGGNAGKRSVHTGGPPNFPNMSRDGIFYIDSVVRLTDVTDGESNTFLFGERYHRDSQFDRLQLVLRPGGGRMAQLGMWGFVADVGAMSVTLHTAVPINYKVRSDGDVSTLFDRACAFGSGHP